MSTDEYEDKRDFDATDEPEPGDTNDAENHRFVIQQHDASSMHYDFRIEADGVLKSWAVPNGPSTDPSEKRLAVRTEDHPIEYADFEGVIPEDEYGAGAVLIWDRGTYENIKEPNDDGERPEIDEQIDDGRVSIRLDGEKISGAYELVQMDGDDWLLIKHDDDAADARRNPTSTEPSSVESGRDIEEIYEDEGDEDGDE